jgi:hypothetical protein
MALATAVVMLLGIQVAAEVPNAGETPGKMVSKQTIAPRAKVGTGESILFAPSDVDYPTFRADVVAAGAGSCDYYDARAGIPTLGELLAYDVVYTWANYSYADDISLGDVLADYVDAGGVVILGTWAYPGPWNALGGRVTTSGYSPVSYTAVTSTNPSYNGDGASCIFSGISSYSIDYHATDATALGAGVLDGTLTGGYVAAAYRPDFKVMYVAGTTIAYTGEFPELIATAASCGVAGGQQVGGAGIPTTGKVGTVVFIFLLVGIGGLLIARRLA